MKYLRRGFICCGLFCAYMGLVNLADSGVFEHGGMEMGSEYYRSDGVISRASNGVGLRHASRTRFHPKRLERECSFFHPVRGMQESSKEIVTIVDEAARQYGIDRELLFAVMFVESRCNHRAISPRGAVGLMQVMPATGRSLGFGNVYLVKANIHAGAKYLSVLKKRFGSVQLALAAYNAGPAVVATYSGIPPYRETRKYTSDVITLYNALRHARALERSRALVQSQRPSILGVSKS